MTLTPSNSLLQRHSDKLIEVIKSFPRMAIGFVSEPPDRLDQSPPGFVVGTASKLEHQREVVSDGS